MKTKHHLPKHQAIPTRRHKAHKHAHQEQTVHAGHNDKLELVRIEYNRNGKRYVHDFTGALLPYILTLHDTSRKALHNYALLDLHDGRFTGGEFHD